MHCIEFIDLTDNVCDLFLIRLIYYSFSNGIGYCDDNIHGYFNNSF